MPLALRFEGIQTVVEPGQTVGIGEIVLDYPSELHGVQIFPQSGTVFGDKGSLDIVIPGEEGDTLVHSFANNAYLSPEVGAIVVTINSETDSPAEVPTGLKYRFTYVAVDTNGRKCIVWLRLKK